MIGICALIKNDLDGYSLNNLDVASCRVLGREKRKDRSRACHDTIDSSIKFLIGICIHFDFYLLSRFYPLKLGFLVIGSDSKIIQRDHRHQGLSRLDLITDFNRPL